MVLTKLMNLFRVLINLVCFFSYLFFALLPLLIVCLELTLIYCSQFSVVVFMIVCISCLLYVSFLAFLAFLLWYCLLYISNCFHVSNDLVVSCIFLFYFLGLICLLICVN